MDTSTKSCLECGEALKGRIDKKFCDDQCRSAHNNRANSDTTAEMRNINNILRKNRRILAQLCKDEGKAKISKRKLEEVGFQFKYHTHTYTTQKGVVYKLSYEYGICALEADWYLAVKWGQKEW